MQDDLKSGLVVRVTGGEVWVDVDGRTTPCQLRGRFRRGRDGFSVAAGDRVDVHLSGSEGGAGAIENVQERVSWLSRYHERDASERLIVANVDTLFVVAALQEPPLHLEFLDRVLVSAERGHVPARVIANKVDLVGASAAGAVADLEAVYGPAGYPVLGTSAESGAGIDELSALLGRGVYAFVGESGVGKSSLLMRLDAKLNLKVNEVGERSGRGRHTTTFSQLYPFRDGYLADTPGVQTFGFAGSDPFELPSCFPEIAANEDCRFRPCTHSHEPQCGVREAVADGRIPQSRYRSYLHIRAEVEGRVGRRAPRRPR